MQFRPWRRILFLVWLIAICRPAALCGQQPSKRARFLLLDSRIIDEASGARLTVGKVKKHRANPLFREDKPWEKRFDNLYPNVLFDPQDKLYKCWYNPFIIDADFKPPKEQWDKVPYRPRNRELALCYAFSKDGIRWQKPELGIVEFEGSTKNNLVLRSSVGPGILLDASARDRQKRFRLFGRTGLRGTAPFEVSFSPDGIHWGRRILCPGIDPRPVDGTHYNALWVPELGQYVGFTRLRAAGGRRVPVKKVRSTKARQVGRTTSKDFLKWTRAKLVFEGSDTNLQVYSMPVFRYAHLYLGLPVMYNYTSDRAFTGLAWSPDTFNWHFIAEGTPLIANSKKKGDYDWGCAYSSAYPIFLDKEIRLYYGASNGRHFGWRDGFFCLATLRPDGFAGYEPVEGSRPARITTKPIVCTGDKLQVSGDVPGSGSIRVTVLNKENKALAESELIARTVTDAEVHWKRGFSLEKLKGKRIRLRFELRDAKFYSFSFQGVMVSGASIAVAEKPVPVGLQKQLFVDDHVVAKKENVTLEVGQAKKYGVVMKPTLPTDFQSGKVHDGPDGGYGYESHFCWFFSPYWNTKKNVFQMWYMGSNRPRTGLCYAESKDGFNWTKPKISKDGKTNLVNWNSPVPILRHKKSMDLFDTGINGVTMTVDPSLPYGSEEKYKVAFYPMFGGSDCTTRLGYSADGINWKLYNKGYPVTGRAADTNNQIHWNPLTKRYLLHCRQDFKGGGGRGELRGVRIMEHSKGNDLINHPAAWKTLTTFALKDPNKALIPGTKTPVYQIHTFPMWYYEGVWFGLTDILAATNEHLKKGTQDYHTRHDRGVWEFYMAPSRDGIKYDFSVAAYPRKPLIPRGPAGSFDKDCVRPPSNIVTHNDEHWVYYLATNERWGCHKWDARLALAKLRLDGFFYLEAKEKPGTVVTKPFKLEGDKLQVNVDAKAGWVQVELLNETGKEIPGFSGKDAAEYRAVDELRFQPAWKNAKDLSALKGKVARIRFRLRNARLYAFQIRRSTK